MIIEMLFDITLWLIVVGMLALAFRFFWNILEISKLKAMRKLAGI